MPCIKQVGLCDAVVHIRLGEPLAAAAGKYLHSHHHVMVSVSVFTYGVAEYSLIAQGVRFGVRCMRRSVHGGLEVAYRISSVTNVSERGADLDILDSRDSVPTELGDEYLARLAVCGKLIADC